MLKLSIGKEYEAFALTHSRAYFGESKVCVIEFIHIYTSIFFFCNTKTLMQIECNGEDLL